MNAPIILGKRRSSPLARRLAKEAGIELGLVDGSGPQGRVVARDINEARDRLARKQTSVGGASTLPRAVPSDADIRALYKEDDYELIAHDMMRKTIAQRLATSARDIPHFFLSVDCNLDKLLAVREEINSCAPRNEESIPAYKISVNDFIIKALAVALQRVPEANVTWTERAMLKHRVSDVSVAVSVPGGLITPVIRNAHLKAVSAISTEMKDLAERARARRLKPEEYQGGTTSVSNLGMYGIREFTAVINPPQVSILAVGAAGQRVVSRNGKIEIANIVSVTMSCDHRAIDGALGAELVSAFKMLIENPVMMMV
jgi:pyruvate dehydrogenase E2 component (dihydrolipoamide acetyltransferase)